ncbi:MAG: Cys-tRNA(Pro) deacylase [Acidimicrobiales bacterium]|jgi:Cys-tRNA(Pro)/Cys-tRNA(Cys) deacylase
MSTPALDLVARSGKDYRLHEYNHDPAVAYGLEAARVLGVEAARVFKTLVVVHAGCFAVAVIPVSSDLDLKAMASALEVKKVAMAEPSDAERATGYVAGGISPIGQKRRLPIVVDESASCRPTVFVSGGQRGLELELSPADLEALTGASFAPVSRASMRRRAHRVSADPNAQ